MDSTEDYVNLMKNIFDFKKLKQLINGSANREPFNVLIDSMNGGEYFFCLLSSF